MNKTYNLTHSQKRVWYTSRIFSDVPICNIGGYIRIKGQIDFKLLEKSINLYIKNNDGLRLKFLDIDTPVQYVENYYYTNFEYKDFSIFENNKESFLQWIDQEVKKDFDMENSLLFKVYLFKLSENDNGYLLKIHHVIADGWSIGIMTNEVLKIYEKLSSGENAEDSSSSSYLNYIEKEKSYINSEKFNKRKKYWNEMFQNEDCLENIVPVDSIEGKRKTYEVSEQRTNKIEELTKELGCSLNTIFTSLYAIYANKAFGHSRIPIGTACFNRSGKKERKTFGMCTSTISSVFNILSECDVKTLIKEHNRIWLNGYRNQEYPYDLLISDLKLQKQGINSLFNVCINYYSSLDMHLNGMRADVYQFYNGYQPYSLQIIVRKWNEKLFLDFDYKISEYNESEIDELYNCLNNLIDQIHKNPDERVCNLKLIANNDFEKLIYDFNYTQANYPHDKTVYELFEQQAKNNPEKIAISFKAEKLSYKSLNEKSNQLANFLIKKGFKIEDKVGIITTHSIETVIGILGVLKAGGAYVPIDFNYPDERIKYMLEDSDINIILTNVAAPLSDFKGEIINLTKNTFCNESMTNISKKTDPNNLAYIIYTSGSTGNPKGVMVEHKGLTNYIYWTKTKYVKDENDVFALYSSLSFDLTVTSIFTPLISGCKIVVYRDDDENEYVLYKILKDNKATIVKLTPSHLLLLKDLDNRNSVIRVFIVGGENLKVSVAKNVYDSFGKDIDIYNEYGPTETVVGCMIYRFDPKKDLEGSVPVGFPINNTQIYVLNNDLQPLPLGYVGEMYIGGDGVARGYINHHGLTNEKFIDNPFVHCTKMYKTGDLAKFLNFKEIEYLGRADSQVKIRGYRIELGEIEKAISSYKNIKDAVVTVIDNKNNKILCAYFEENGEVDIQNLRNHLTSVLPEYMVPVHFIKMNKFPLTNNGKVNKKLLPEPEQFANQNLNFNENLNHKETMLVKVISEILGIEKLSMNDNFYYIGGDSIKAIQISSKFKEVGYQIAINDILSSDTIFSIISRAEINIKENNDYEVLSGIITNSPIVDWFFFNEFENQNYYNQSVIIKLSKDYDNEAISNAMYKIIKHHDALRINYNKEKNQLFYNNKFLDQKFDVITTQINNIDELSKKGENIKSNFDIEGDLLISVYDFRIAENQMLLFTAHHLVVDGISWQIILNDFMSLLEKPDFKLLGKSTSYSKWSYKLNERNSTYNFEKEILYLEGIYKSDLKLNNFVFTKNQTHTEFLELGENQTTQIIDRCKELYNLNVAEFLIITLALSLFKITNFEEIVLDIEGHGRESLTDSISLDRTVGWFTSIYPLILKYEKKNNIDETIKNLKEQIRKIPNNGFNFLATNYYRKTKNKRARFNYIGDMDAFAKSQKFEVLDVDSGPNVDPNNKFIPLVDVNAIKINKKLKITIEGDLQNISYLKKMYEEKIDMILNHCISKSKKEFTPSDFDIDVSQEDIDNLFF